MVKLYQFYRGGFDAGFDKLVIIPMGANKVFLRSLDDGDVNSLLSEAANFFNNFSPILCGGTKIR